MYVLRYVFISFVLFILIYTLTSQFYSPLDPAYPLHPNPFPSDKPKPRLSLSTGNRFRIGIFSDLHYGEDEATFGPEQDRKSTDVIGKLLDFETPDFVIINGDFITGENTFLENSTKYVDQIVSPMVEKNYRWASTYGNHDTQYNLSREALFLEDSKYDLSYTQHSPKGVSGVTNYWLPIYRTPSHASYLSSSDRPVSILWFFDSLGGERFQRWGLGRWMPNYVPPSAVKWFLSERQKVEERWGVVPSLAFVHIPPTPFLRLQRKKMPGRGDKDAHFPGLNDDVPVANQGEGRWGEPDRAFVRALKSTKGLHSIYSGHDHGNSWCGTWDEKSKEEEDEAKKQNPFLCFVKHTGYGGYGSWNRGSRVVELQFGDEDIGSTMEVGTWIQMENGDVVQNVNLNATYGTDIYPIEDGED